MAQLMVFLLLGQARMTILVMPARACDACVPASPSIQAEAQRYGSMVPPAKGQPPDVQATILAVTHRDQWEIRVSVTAGEKHSPVLVARGKTLEEAGKVAGVRIVSWTQKNGDHGPYDVEHRH